MTTKRAKTALTMLLFSAATFGANATTEVHITKYYSFYNPCDTDMDVDILSVGPEADMNDPVAVSATFEDASFRFGTVKIWSDAEQQSGQWKFSTLTCTDAKIFSVSEAFNINGGFKATNTDVEIANLKLYRGKKTYFTMTGGTLTLSGDEAKVHWGTMTLENVDATATTKITRDDSYSFYKSEILFSGATTFTGTHISVNTLSISDTASVSLSKGIEADDLTISDDASVTLASGAKIVAENLTIVTDDAANLNLATIFGGADALVKATNVTVQDSNGNAQDVTIDKDANGYLVIPEPPAPAPSVPEPSAFGLLAGAFALALCAARRRREKKS